MQYYLFTLSIIICLLSCEPAVTEVSEVHQETIPDTVAFNAVLAEELKADEYGMAKYVMAFLKRGPNRSTDTEEANRLQAAHMKNISRLMDEGKMSMAGPFLDDGELRGIYIFNVETVEEARTLTETDPAIQAGSLVMELHPWYATAALQRIKDLHSETAKKSF